MTPKEKGKELIEKYSSLHLEMLYTDLENDIAICKGSINIHSAKLCALTEVKGILSELFQNHKINFYKQVKKEIEIYGE